MILIESKQYTFLGVEEGNTICDFCHKRELYKLFVVQDNVTQEIRYFGSQCIKKALQIPDSELKREKNKLYAKISQEMNSALWKFDREVIDVEKKRYIASYKKKDIPWEYSPVKKALEKQRLELEKTYLAKLKFLK